MADIEAIKARLARAVATPLRADKLNYFPSGWLAVDTGECTCAGPAPDSYSHEPHCGLEQAFTLGPRDAWQDPENMDAMGEFIAHAAKDLQYLLEQLEPYLPKENDHE